MPILIEYAAFGMNQNVMDLTAVITSLYNDKNFSVFQVQDCALVTPGGRIPLSDPDPGVRKSLYIVWSKDNGDYSSGVTYEEDTGNITIQ